MRLTTRPEKKKRTPNGRITRAAGIAIAKLQDQMERVGRNERERRRRRTLKIMKWKWWLLIIRRAKQLAKEGFMVWERVKKVIERKKKMKRMREEGSSNVSSHHIYFIDYGSIVVNTHTQLKHSFPFHSLFCFINII